MLLAALPATPVQLAHACYELGFEIVVPASWGDELVAQAVLEDLRHRDREPVIQCTCPLVAERLLANGQHLLPSMVQTASPAVAAARYARQAFAPRDLNITYIGACPGARHSAIDERCVPDELLRALAERDISLADMPTVFDSVLPPDRRRFASLPGGCPTQEALWQASDGRMLREVTQPTFSTDLAQTLVWREHVMVDVAPSLGCACAGSSSRLGARSGRVAVMAVEPPRATQAVVNFKPDFAAPAVQPLVTAESANGDTPPARTPRPHEEVPLPTYPDDEVEPVAEPSGYETPDYSEQISRVRGRVRTPTPLPRAYLAKRRHLGSSAPTPEPAPTTSESESDYPAIGPLAAAFELHEQTRAEADLELLGRPNETTPSTPNEVTAEPTEISRPIAVHVEPEPHTSEEVTTQNVHVPDADGGIEVPPDLQAQLFLEESSAAKSVATENAPPSIATETAPESIFTEIASESVVTEITSESVVTAITADGIVVATDESITAATAVEGVATATLDDSEKFAPPADVPVIAEKRIEEPRSVVEASGPLRVEVEIYEEAESTRRDDVVIPDAIENEDVASVAPEIVGRPRSAWADFLIALWLVLVASAVIATLLWRR